ncbi:hypothetical protein GGI15_001563 [Coemansia interrupta]|uniref:Uncharacterized protein n=1 Tax=Coemansia interrupta TaxID=1126814 RepID=A0A9W8HL27_9FUNG|nr:hypothetical protein GGI15_001563 [Coemansia interrupta]
MNLITRLAAAIVMAVLSSYAYVYLSQSFRMTGLGKTYHNVNTTSCIQMGHGVLHGCEDIEVDPYTGLAYLACGSLKPRQHWLNPDDAYDFAHETQTDHIYAMDENDEYTEIRPMELSDSGEMIPFSQTLRLHGFDIYWNPDDTDDMTFMFVNHQLEHAGVSIFSYRRGSDYMLHVETVKSGLLHSPNNIVAMSKRSFYATNDMKYTRGILREISMNLRIPNGHVVYRNESGEFSIAANHIGYPNGIAKSGDWIYIASCTDPGVQVYRALPDGSLKYHGRNRYWNSIPDNLHVDHLTGQIYSTSFLKVRQTHKFFKNPSLDTTDTAGTKLLRLTPRGDDPGNGFDVETLLIDSGRLMPTATIAAVQRRNGVKRLLIGGVMSHSLVGLARSPGAVSGSRLYTSEGSDMLKGTPKFTRMRPKSAKSKLNSSQKNGTNTDTEWGTSGRPELNRKNLGRLVFIGGAVATGVGLMGVAAYYIGTYFYLRSKWPVSENINSSTARNLLYLATYYERLEPNPRRALAALEKTLDMVTEINSKSAPLAQDSLDALDIKVRIAECLYNVGRSTDAANTIRKILPDLSKKAGNDETMAEARALLYRISVVLGRTCADDSRFNDAISAYGIGLHAVKQLKQDFVRKFNSSNLLQYTELDNINLKEAVITMLLAEAFNANNDKSTAETLFKSVLASAKQHKAHLDVAPRVVTDIRTFKDEWACLDVQAMVYLAKIQGDTDNGDSALLWIESAESSLTNRRDFDIPRCIDCMSEIYSELGRISELKGDNKKALRKYREAYETARLNFRDTQDRYLLDVKRLEN